MQHFDLIIVGTGSGNSILDERFRGKKVALIERNTFGGTCLNVGCIPTKMLVYTADVAATPGHSSRLGVDATLDAVRWSDIRERIFADRIDQIAAGGRDYRISHEDNANVTVFEGDARFTGPRQFAVAPNDGGAPATITADEVVLAAGSRPAIPDIEGLAGVDFHTSDTVMRLEELPATMTILGSGFIAAEFAHVFSSLGVAVTLVARSGALLRAQDADVSERFTEVARASWDVRLNTSTRRVEQHDDGVRLHVEAPDGPGVIESEVLLVATGRTPNTDQLDVAAGGLETDEAGLLKVDEYQRAVVGGTRGEKGAVAGGAVVPGVWALGDICSPYQLKHVANHEQRVVQHNLAEPELVAADHRFVPHAVFSSPQVASVGLTEVEAVERGLDISVARQDYGGVAYGWAMEDTTGFAKLIADRATGLLVGAHIIGPQASSLIQPLIQAMSFGQPVANLARGQYWIHPSLPELIENALLQLDA